MKLVMSNQLNAALDRVQCLYILIRTLSTITL